MLVHSPTRSQPRTGSTLPILAVCMTALISLVALGVDVGMLMVAKTQAQNAADIGALTGARSLTGTTTASSTDGITPASNAVTNNQLFNSNIAAGQVQVNRSGQYNYNASAGAFQPIFSGFAASEPFGAHEVTILVSQPTYFAKIFGISAVNIGATAQAVHRPRDIALILDYSGSMAFGSQFNAPHPSGGVSSHNPDANFPQFGPWSMYTPSNYSSPPTVGNYTTYSPQNPMQRVVRYVTSVGETYAENNFTVETRNGPPIVQGWDTISSTGNAFTALEKPSSYKTAPGGDNFPIKNLGMGSGFAATVQEYLNEGSQTDNTTVAHQTAAALTAKAVAFNTGGYGTSFNGYTVGPGYYGKTFYMWPPDPRALKDWRKRFFFNGDGSAFNGDNSRLFGTNGRLRRYNSSQNEVFNSSSGSTYYYRVNYNAILAWLTTEGPAVLPTSLRCGRVVYYDAIPTNIPSSNTASTYNSLSVSQKFFKEYIDYVLGINNYDTANTSYGQNSNNAYGSNTYGPINAASGSTRYRIRGQFASSSETLPTGSYMFYTDMPVHPRLHFWFGPLSLMGFLSGGENGRGNWLPGTCREAQCWQLKAGVSAAIQDIKSNHPNDNASVNFFSSNNGYNTARVTMGRSYEKMRNALWYPNNSSLVNGSNTTVSPFSSANPASDSGTGYTLNNSAGANIPNADGGTNTEMGLVVAFNQLSAQNSGRRGANKIVVLETDGVPNQIANTTFTGRADGKSTFSNPTNQGPPSGVDGNTWLPARDDAVTLAAQLASLETATPQGFATAKSPVYIHAIAFGDLFEPAVTSGAKTNSLEFLLRVQKAGKTSATGDTALPATKIITGEYNERIEGVRSIFENIMQSGVSITLIK